MVKKGETVGHILQLFLKTCSVILLSGSSIKVHVTGKTEDQRENGLEVPWIVTVKVSEHIYIFK